MKNKKFSVIILTIIFILAVASVTWAEIPTDPNSGESLPGPNTHIDNSGMTTTPDTPKPPVPEKITIKVNGQEVTSDVPPYETQGRIMVPYRFVAEALGCKVDWDGAFQKVTATKGGSQAWMMINMKVIGVNGRTMAIDVAPVLKSDRTFVPVRFMSEALGYKVNWDAATNTVSIEG
ncbi:MAG: copper amine oxidase N-terminal domain-containing protein [Desulfocucumaceae bacterium]